MSWRREVRLLSQHSSVARLFPEVWEVWPCNLAFACRAGLVCPVSLCHSWRHLLLVLPFVSLLFPTYFWVFTCQWLLGWCEGIALAGCLRKAGLWNLNSQEAEVSPEPLSFTSTHQKRKKRIEFSRGQHSFGKRIRRFQWTSCPRISAPRLSVFSVFLRLRIFNMNLDFPASC